MANNLITIFSKNKNFKKINKVNFTLYHKEWINELIYFYGKIYLFLGYLETFEDSYYILSDYSGILTYHSCVEALDFCLKDKMCSKEYKQVKKNFLVILQKQRSFKKTFDSRVFLQKTDDNYKIHYCVYKNIPIIKEYRHNIESFVTQRCSKAKKKEIRIKFLHYLLHLLGFHIVYNIQPRYNEEKLYRTGKSPSILTGYCSICKQEIKVKESNWLLSLFNNKYVSKYRFFNNLSFFLKSIKRAK